MKYSLNKRVRDDDALRRSFMELAERVFGLSFQEWYEGGYWTHNYIPYVFAEDNRVIANASVNLIDTVWQGIPKRYIQIGTVMTAPEYRGRGLSSRLLSEIITDWKDRCDCVYLFANGSVLDFYPKFGFVQAEQYQQSCGVAPGSGSAGFKKLDMDGDRGREILKRCYEKSNPFSALPMKNNFGLVMFYCGAFLKNCVFYSRELDLVCVAERKGDTLICCDVFGGVSVPNCSLEEVVCGVADGEVRQAVFGFTPKKAPEGSVLKIDGAENDETLFVWKGKENIFLKHHVMLPLLSHA